MLTAKSVLFVFVLALIGLEAPARAQVNPNTQPLLKADQFVYLGAFTAPKTTVPDAKEPDRLEYGGYALAIGPDGNSLYIGCHDWGDRLARVSIAAIGDEAQIVERCTEIPAWEKIANENGRVNGLVVGGALFYNGRLFVNGYTFYDNTGGHLATTFAGPSISGLQGPWRVGAKQGVPPGVVAGNMAIVPIEWRKAIGAPVLSGLCCISTIGRSSFGPAMVAWDPEDVGKSNAARWLVGYPEDHKTLGPYDSAGEYYGMAMTMGGLGWLPGTRSPFAVVNRPTTYCYGEGTPNRSLDRKPNGKGQIYCFDPFDDDSNGYHSEGYELSVIVFDGNQLAEVKSGRREPWDVKPVARYQLPGGILEKEITSAAFDPDTRRLYVAMRFGPNPKVHVWQANEP